LINLRISTNKLQVARLQMSQNISRKSILRKMYYKKGINIWDPSDSLLVMGGLRLSFQY
jgi:hypothetical protein